VSVSHASRFACDPSDRDMIESIAIDWKKQALT
jgi:hypothetical protein